MLASDVVIKRQRDRVFWQDQVREWRASGLKANDYVAQHGLCHGQFKRWRYRLNREQRAASALNLEGFIPLRVEPPVISQSLPTLVINTEQGVSLRCDLPSEQIVKLIKEWLCGS